MNSENYCQDKAAPPGSNLYYALLFLSREQRRKFHALFALQQELASTVIECKDPGVARIKLQWWCEEIDRLYEGLVRHPVTREFQALSPELNLPQSELLHLVSAMTEAINPSQAESLAQMLTHFSQGQGRIWQVAAGINGCVDSKILEQLASLAGHYYCMEFFQSATQHMARGYCPYPRLEMESHGLSQESLLDEANAVARGALLFELFGALHAGLVRQAKKLADEKYSSVLFALILARIASVNCRRLQKNPGLIASHSSSLTPLRKLWIAWRAK